MYLDSSFPVTWYKSETLLWFSNGINWVGYCRVCSRSLTRSAWPSHCVTRAQELWPKHTAQSDCYCNIEHYVTATLTELLFGTRADPDIQTWLHLRAWNIRHRSSEGFWCYADELLVVLTAWSIKHVWDLEVLQRWLICWKVFLFPLVVFPRSVPQHSPGARVLLTSWFGFYSVLCLSKSGSNLNLPQMDSNPGAETRHSWWEWETSGTGNDADDIRMSCLWFPAEENNNRLANPEIMLNLCSSHKHLYWTQEAAAAENDAD